MPDIQFLVMDVDGTLTDGKIYMGPDGEIAKVFDIKDGGGLSLILPKHRIVPVIITARESKILENRCRELHITELYQGVKEKRKILSEILAKRGAKWGSVAYVGDDLPDIPCMEMVKTGGGAVLCPADAIPEIKALAEYISGYKAGEGAVRDCIHYIVQRNRDREHVVEERIQKAVGWILAGNFTDSREGTLPDGSKYVIQEYMTKAESECVLETHQHHIEIQYMIRGCEEFRTYTTNCLTGTGEYHSEKDVEYWQGGIIASQYVLVPGSLLVVYSDQPHKGAISFGKPEKVRKLVCRVEV